jgi:hypothetical protein
MTQQQWLALAEAVGAAYRKGMRKSATIDRAKLHKLLVLFHKFYCTQSSHAEDELYIANLMQGIHPEDMLAPKIYTVAEAVERAERCIFEESELWAREGEIVSCNLINVLAKENFPSDLSLNAS